MNNLPNCPKCQSSFTYQDGNLFICPECAHEWSEVDSIEEKIDESNKICDAYGNELKDGDTITVVKDLKIKGASSVLKVGTKVKNIRLVESDDGHNISCKVEGIGAMNLKSEFVKKS